MEFTPEMAEELFLRGRKAAYDLKRIHAHREQLRSGMPSAGMPSVTAGGGVSDPTGRAGNYLADMSAEWEQEEAADLAEIREVRQLCKGVGRGLHDPMYQLVLESYYILLNEWKQVANLIDRSLSKVYSMRQTALEYVAFVGPAAAKQGLGRAEE